MRDHAASPPCAITTWDDAYHAAIVYGTAEILGADAMPRTHEVAKEQGYAEGDMRTVRITPTRIYAIRPPAGHPRAG